MAGIQARTGWSQAGGPGRRWQARARPWRAAAATLSTNGTGRKGPAAGPRCPPASAADDDAVDRGLAQQAPAVREQQRPRPPGGSACSWAPVSSTVSMLPHPFAMRERRAGARAWALGLTRRSRWRSRRAAGLGHGGLSQPGDRASAASRSANRPGSPKQAPDGVRTGGALPVVGPGGQGRVARDCVAALVTDVGRADAGRDHVHRHVRAARNAAPPAAGWR